MNEIILSCTFTIVSLSNSSTVNISASPIYEPTRPLRLYFVNSLIKRSVMHSHVVILLIFLAPESPTGHIYIYRKWGMIWCLQWEYSSESLSLRSNIKWIMEWKWLRRICWLGKINLFYVYVTYTESMSFKKIKFAWDERWKLTIKTNTRIIFVTLRSNSP
jgi:hypothetical protein